MKQLPYGHTVNGPLDYHTVFPATARSAGPARAPSPSPRKQLDQASLIERRLHKLRLSLKTLLEIRSRITHRTTVWQYLPLPKAILPTPLLFVRK